MSAISNYLENALLDHVFGGSSLSQPANVYLALFTSDPTDAGTGTEVSGGSYARQTLSYAAASGGSKATNADVSFTDMPAATVTHVGIFDALTGGNLLMHGALTASKSVGSGDTLTVESGNLTLTLA